jgi:hypothetical protein
VLDNANRWFRQFGAEPLDAVALAKLPRVPIADTDAVWVTAAGDYSDGMGAPPKPGFGLAGVVATVKGQILTVKMIGPKAEVEAAKPVLEGFVKSLHMVD